MSGKVKNYFAGIKWEALSLLFIFLFSLTLRFYLIFEFPRVIFLGEADAIGYFAIAKSILNAWELGETSLHFPPFYPFVIAIVSLITGDIEIAGRTVSCIMGGLLVFPVYFIGKELYDKKTGFLAAIAAIFFSVFIDSSLKPLSQATYVTLLTTGIYFGIVSVKIRSNFLYILLGLTFGAAYLTRPEGLAGFLFVASIILAALFYDRSSEVKKKLKEIFLMFFGFLIIALPYINYLHRETGIWTISGKAAVTVVGVDASAKLLPSGKTVGETMKGKVAVGELSPSVQAFFKTYLTNMSKFGKVLVDEFSAICIIIALIGVFISTLFLFKQDSLKKVKIHQTMVLLGSLAAVLPVFAFSNLALTFSYILPLFPILMIWLSLGLVSLEDGFLKLIAVMGFNRVEKCRKWSLISAAVIIFISYSSFMPFWKDISSDDSRYYVASRKFFLKDTGVWLKNNTPEDAVVMSRWSNMGFYADRKWVYIPDGEIPEVVKYAKEHGVTHIVIDSEAVPKRRPGLAPLLIAPQSGLKPVYEREKYWIRVLIYEVL